MRRLALPLLLATTLATACGKTPAERYADRAVTPFPAPSVEDDDGTIRFAPPGSRSGPTGSTSFTFGVATAPTQIEDRNFTVDWYVWSDREDGLGQSEAPLGEASRGFTRALDDVELLRELNVDLYRFGIEWARVEPVRGQYDEEALAHYDRFIDALVEAGIRPMITLHHFSNPVWVDDPRDPSCADGPSDTNLCGWDHPEGAEMILDDIERFARMLGERYGDRVDEWCTVNEPINYLLAAYGAGYFPPGKTVLLSNLDRFIDVVRNYLRAHVRMYDAIHEADTTDATGDGIAASVGYTLSVAEWVPARRNRPSDHPDDLAAVERINHIYHHFFTDALVRGAFDPDLDASFSEPQPDWEGKVDWLGVQYYFRGGATGEIRLIPGVRATVCYAGFDAGSCLAPEDPTHFVPEMGYEYWAPGLYNRLVEFSERWPDLPLTVTESGLATNVGARRAEHVVRSLEQIHRAIADGADVRGYFHWTLMDNFEWAEGYGPRFGLYFVDFGDTWDRTLTEGGAVFAEIAGARTLTPDQRAQLGGLGPMTPEAEHGE